MSHPDPTVIDALRARIWALERKAPATAEVIPIAPEIDTALPWGGLPLACLHEIVVGDGAAFGFTAVLLGRLAQRGPVLWCRSRHADQMLYLPGLEEFGLAGNDLLVVNGRTEVDLLWAAEEGLRCPEIGAVVAELGKIDLTAGRRLQLAAETGSVTGLLLLPPRAGSATGTTRWRVSAAPSSATPWQGIGDIRWHLALDRCRGGMPREWHIEWQADARQLYVLGDKECPRTEPVP